ncbi:putative RNA recognition domain containing protein,expressed [Monocercomonoides exilis]|uniref:putative RNA recognition domain containing protein,expressed n=1 Tax=Monocercomonoides exilis TaxID=2049356 RepID=UPI00355A5E3F|nr:putative RNA recognition domain containing protein,expressed [Monocercomonoides exilis]|eukprot:MONOS_834.1-p1 / transcript=MONOS_834.1 / gene=MONOS_834 / organism=Monocercomonoides_exilis_PA203 / gene_product=RNA recognition domain containing protein,expressed / transcript_product=RNA recognition domain containing protein,expressed / location=Mono_scaffold00014:18041-19586(-) / protein_length=469 / sequence_SO=supercontig / SO=protein_coding / is_pseudo=false
MIEQSLSHSVPAERAPNPPSKVVHIRNVSSGITQGDLTDLCSKYGAISNILMLKAKNQALVQFQDVSGAINFITACSKYAPSIRSVPIYPQFSNHSEIRIPAPPAGTESSRILLCTIQNPFYSITVDVLNTIMSPYDTDPRGTVEKIVIFQKTAGLQALVQFSNADCAARAKTALDGKNIYSNCCTLQIQYSNLSDLTIKENSEKSRDFTNPSLPEKKQTGDGLLGFDGPDGRGRAGTGLMGPGSFGRGGMRGMGGMGGMSGMSSMGGMHVQSGDRCVLLVSGFPPERVGCEQLFNLFSNYGIVIRIKILFTKPNMALVQFAEGVQASQAMNYLRNVRMFGSTLEVNYSKFPTITEPSRPSSDGKTVTYEGSSLNRFSRFRQINLRNMTAPTEVLHVSGLANGTTEDAIMNHLQRVVPVSAVKIFEHSEKLMALVQFDSVDSSVEAMCQLHNSVLNGKHIRLSFTRNHI